MGYVSWKYGISPSFNYDMKAMVTYNNNSKEVFKSKLMYFSGTFKFESRC